MKRYLIPLLLILFSCSSQDKPLWQYHRFQNDVWQRFDKLQFSIPVKHPGKYDVVFETTYTPEFIRDLFSINMIMNTPSGEERINEYSFQVKDRTGRSLGKCAGDTCTFEIMLKKGILLEEGELKLEIENLIPYIKTEGLKGAGIRLVPVG
jgi:gliding motility-associated lipoprotein GldH